MTEVLGPGLTPLPLALVLGMAVKLAICGACWHVQQCRLNILDVQPGPQT